MARRFGVSRTPVREAFRQLAVQGLVENRPHRGVVVTPMTADLVRELHEAYAVVGCACVRLAARDGQRRQNFQGMTDADSIASAIHAAAGNAVLRDLGGGLWGRLRPYRSASLRLRNVAEYLADGDGEEAAKELSAAIEDSMGQVAGRFN